MSIEVDLLNWIGVYEEPNNAYGVDNSANPGQFLHLPYKEGTLQIDGDRELLDPMTGKMRLDGHDKKVLGIRKCTGNVGLTLHSHGVDLDGNHAVPTNATWALLRVLKAIMGGSIATTNPSAQTQVQAGTTATVVNVTAGHGARFQAGGVIACQVVSGSSSLEAREILSVETDAISVKEAFSAVPISASPVRGGVTVHMTEDPDTSLQFFVEGRENSDGAVFCGLQGGFKIEGKLGELATMSLTLEGAYWKRLGTSNVTIPDYSNYSPMALVPDELHVPTVGSTSRTLVDNATTTVEPNVVYGKVRSGGAPETVLRQRRQAVRPLVKGSFTTEYQDDTWYNARDNRDVRALFRQLGSLPGSIVLISCPTIQITGVKRATMDTGVRAVQVEYEARHDEALALTTAVGYSALRLHFV